jgi:subtilase family serine protease
VGKSHLPFKTFKDVVIKKKERKGSRQLIWKADAGGAVAESNETNTRDVRR